MSWVDRPMNIYINNHTGRLFQRKGESCELSITYNGPGYVYYFPIAASIGFSMVFPE